MNTNSNKSLHERDKNNYLQAFRRFPIAIERGKGSNVWDVEGNKYVDALAGIAVNNVGHCHPKVVEAVQKQAETLMHISNFFVNIPQVELSEKLIEISGLDRVFITNSGAESLEGAIKIARKYAHSQGRGGTIISFTGSFHGRTLATIATGKEEYQQGFEPIPKGFVQAEFNELDSVKSKINNEVAAILVEPIQGEGGINVARPDFLKGLREICDENDLVLIFDEVQCGVGRTGYWFAKDLFEVAPDIMALAKGLGGGAPVGAVLSNEKVSQAIEFGDHGSTFGGNPLVCAAALATIGVIEEENLLEAVRKKEILFKDLLKNIKEEGIKEVRGKGLMIGVEFNFKVKELVLDMLDNGVIANATAGNVLRLVPPLNISEKDLTFITEVLKTSLENIKANV